MECPKCGYVLSPFDQDCPRCKVLGQSQGGPSPSTSPTDKVKINKRSSPLVFFGITAMIVLIAVASFMIGIAVRKEPSRKWNEHDHPQARGTVEPKVSPENPPSSMVPGNRSTGNVSASTSQTPAQGYTGDDVHRMTDALLAAAQTYIQGETNVEFPKRYDGNDYSPKLISAQPGEVRTNIEKTTSLTSPYLGYVFVSFECSFEVTERNSIPNSTERRTYIFGLQDGKWVLTDEQYN